MKPTETAAQLAKRAWPLMLEAWRVYDRLAKSNPNLPEQVKKQAEAVRDRALQVSKQRGAEARILGMLQLARDMAQERTDSEDPGARAASQAWVRQADDIQRALTLAQGAEGANRKRMLRRVRARTDALVAEVFEAFIPAELATEAEGSGRRQGRLRLPRRRRGADQA
jgi:hypothetical protein